MRSQPRPCRLSLVEPPHFDLPRRSVKETEEERPRQHPGTRPRYRDPSAETEAFTPKPNAAFGLARDLSRLRCRQPLARIIPDEARLPIRSGSLPLLVLPADQGQPAELGRCRVDRPSRRPGQRQTHLIRHLGNSRRADRKRAIEVVACLARAILGP